jgi:hypothetical protein
MRGRGWSKYHAQKTKVGDLTFDSKLEARRWNELLMLQRNGAIRNLKRQVPFDLVVNGHHVCKYIADFTYELTSDGMMETVCEDAKGVMTPEFRLKAKLMEAIHGIVIQVWTGKPQWALDTSKGRWLRKTRPPASRKTSSRTEGSPARS